MSADDIVPHNVLLTGNFKNFICNLPIKMQFHAVTGNSLVPTFRYVLYAFWHDESGNYHRTGPEYSASRHYFDKVYPSGKNFLVVVDGYMAVVLPSPDFDSDKKYLLDILGRKVRLTAIDS